MKEYEKAHKHHHAVEELIKYLDAPDRDNWQKPQEILGKIGDVKDKTIMDLGAGTGYFAFKLAMLGANVIAADVEQGFLDILHNRKRKLGIKNGCFEIRKVEFDDPKLKKNEVDAVLIVDTYHHIENTLNYFSKVFNGIVPNGKLIIVDSKKDSTIDDGPSYEMKVAEETVIEELKKVGFNDFKVTNDLLAEQYVIEAFKVKQKKVSGTENMKSHWNRLYREEEYVFGTKPDKYFKEILSKFNAGKILLPGEGEGRNAVYAAKLGWDVHAYDYSKEAKQKAERLANHNSVSISYAIRDIVNAQYPKESFDMVAFQFIHFEGQERTDIHKNLDKHLKTGGILIIQNFSTENPKYSEAGPRTANLLYSKEDILRDFPDYEILDLKVEIDQLQEGSKKEHTCSILRFVGKKL
ncbi:methyltransferase domain-containing protein [Puteibacter caeruleilacunae]|nr:methyltransferase domain-containing protein [Puteibacter caeruleilacunae]